MDDYQEELLERPLRPEDEDDIEEYPSDFIYDEESIFGPNLFYILLR